jgi:ribose transport system ATP-binding protein
MTDTETTVEPFRLQARAIHKSFGGVEVLHGVDLDATGGSVLALLGENGAGKSTLVRILAGDHAPDSGEIVVGGETYAALDPVTARSLGVRMIFQELSDAPALTVAENISLGRWPGRRGFVRWKAVRERALRALDTAKALGHEKALYLAGQGSDPTAHCQLGKNRQWVADAAYFPEN